MFDEADDSGMDRLRVGIALYNAGRYLPAHEPLEELWLEAPAGEREPCLKGLIQASAAVYKSRGGNDEGAIGLAESARGYLTDCSDVDTESLRAWLERLVTDPTVGRETDPPELRLDGEVIGIYDLSPAEAVVAIEAVAGIEGDDLLRTACGYAERDIADRDARSPFLTLALECITDPKPVVRQRLREHVDRRETRDSDVEGLFE